MQHSDASAFAEAMREECLGTRVTRVHRRVARRFEQALAPLGLSLPQLEILATLVVMDAPVRPSELAAVLVVERSTASRNLAAMERHGWVETAERSSTGRAMAVTVTDAGRHALSGARTAWSEAQSDLLDVLGPGAPAALDAWLDQLAD